VDFLSLEARVQGVTQAIAQEVKAQDQEHDRDARE
jgi:hypothetical protein